MWRPGLPVETQLGHEFPGAHSWGGVPNAILNKVQKPGKGSQDSLQLSPNQLFHQNLSPFLFLGELYFSQVLSMSYFCSSKHVYPSPCSVPLMWLISQIPKSNIIAPGPSFLLVDQ